MKQISEILNPIEGKKQQIIELFVEVYGEEYREQITNQIANTEFVWTYKDLKSSLYNALHTESQKISTEFFKRFGYNGNEYIYTEYFDYIYTLFNGLDYKPQYLIRELSKDAYIKLFDLPENFASLDTDYQIDYLTKNKDTLLTKLDYAKQIWYNEFKQNYDLISAKIEEVENNYKYAEEVEADYADKIKELIDDHLGKKIKDSDSLFFASLKYKNILMCGKENIITPQFELNKELFIELCNEIGYNYGDDYSKYLSPEILDFIFDEELLKQYTKLIAEKEKEIIKLSSIKQNIEQLNRIDFANGNANFIMEIYNFINNAQNTAAYCRNFKAANSTLKTLCVCPIDMPDVAILHELGHIIQFRQIFEKHNFTFVKTGVACTAVQAKNFGNIANIDELLEKGSENFNNDVSMQSAINLMSDSSLEKYIDYLLTNPIQLNEVINDYLTMQVCQKANKKGFSIIEASHKPISSYAYAFPILEQLLKTQNKKLIECAMSSDLFKLQNLIGKENHTKLSILIKSFLSMYSLSEISKRVTEKAQSLNMSVLEFAHQNTDNLSINEQEFLNYYIEAEQILKNIDKYISLISNRIK